jgi:hypothetical protein
MKMGNFRVVVPCILVEVYQHFRGPCCLHHQNIFTARKPQLARNSLCLMFMYVNSTLLLSFYLLYTMNSVPFCYAWNSRGWYYMMWDELLTLQIVEIGSKISLS